MPRFQVVRNAVQNPPWWLEEGTEVCPACSHTYVYETEYRCVACDGSVCALCVQHTIQMEVLCPSCITSASES